ncbi:unnamed protein product [Heterobilharzia americana]|nr:unnamed protein product [Heterobilharzia americana]
MNYLYNSFNNLKYIKNEALKSEIQMTQLSHDNSFNFHEIIEQILTKNESVISNFIHLLNSSELIQQFGSFTVNNTGSAINTGKISIQPEVVLSEEEWKKIVKNCLMEENTGQTRNEQQNNFFTSILNKLNELVTETVTPNVIENQKNVSGNQDINHEFDCHLYQGPKTPPSPKSKKKNVKVHSVSPQELSDLKNCKVSEDSKPDDNRSDTCFDSKRTASSHTLDIHKSSMYSNQHSSTSTLKKFYAPHTILTKRAYPEHLSDISPDSNMHYSPCNLEPKADQLHRNMYQYDEQQYSGVYNCKLKPSFERFTQPPCTHSSKTHECISSTEKLARSSKYCKKLSREIDNQLLTGSEKECICSSKKRICPSTYKQYNKGDDTQSSNSCDELTIKRRPNQHPLKSKIFDKCTSEQHSHDRLNSNETDYRYRYVFPKQLHPVSRTEEVSQRHRNVSRYSFVKEEKCRYLSQKKPFRAHDRHNMVGKHELKLGFRSSFNHTTLGSYYPVKKAYFGTSQTVSSPSSYSPLSPPKVAYRINHPCKRYLNSNYSDSCETLNHHNNADNRRANCLKPASFKEVFNESRNSSLSSASSISASGEEKIGMKARLHSVISGMPDGSETVQAIDSSSNGRNYKGVHSSTLFKTISSSKSSYQSSKQSNWPATKDVGKYSSSKINRYIELPSASTSCASTAVKLADQDNISKSCNGDLVKECYIPKPKERSQTARSRSTSSSRSQTSTITSDKSRSASYTSSGSSSISNSVSSVSRHSTSTYPVMKPIA